MTIPDRFLEPTDPGARVPVRSVPNGRVLAYVVIDGPGGLQAVAFPCRRDDGSEAPRSADAAAHTRVRVDIETTCSGMLHFVLINRGPTVATDVSVDTAGHQPLVHRHFPIRTLPPHAALAFLPDAEYTTGRLHCVLRWTDPVGEHEVPVTLHIP